MKKNFHNGTSSCSIAKIVFERNMRKNPYVPASWVVDKCTCKCNTSDSASWTADSPTSEHVNVVHDTQPAGRPTCEHVNVQHETQPAEWPTSEHVNAVHHTRPVGRPTHENANVSHQTQPTSSPTPGELHTKKRCLQGAIGGPLFVKCAFDELQVIRIRIGHVHVLTLL